MSISITHAGKRYNNITDAFQQAILDGFNKIIKDKLKPFEYEIAQSGGKVMIEIKSYLSGASVLVDNIPDDLKQRIENALQ